MKLAIVGTSITLNESKESEIKKSILTILRNYPNETTVISGGAKGVDTIAIDVAKRLGFKTEIYRAEKEEWKYFKPRNIKIAEDCNELYCITIATKNEKCYHHKPKQDHQKTAGCFTANITRRKGKPTRLIIV